jgi:hypothetical protein
VNSQGTNGRPRGSRITVAAILGIALPCILIGGALGALVGSAFDSVANGFRVGVILGGAIAFVILQRKKPSAP